MAWGKMDQERLIFVGMALDAVDDTNRWRWWDATDGGQREALFIRLIINLYDVLKILNSEDRRLAFTDDIEEGIDIHELVRRMRNAACHIESGERNLPGNNALAFAVIKGPIPVAIKCGDIELGNPYADDVAIYYGSRRIYLRRHIVRACAEARESLRAP